jgi:hypothetical protein
MQLTTSPGRTRARDPGGLVVVQHCCVRADLLFAGYRAAKVGLGDGGSRGSPGYRVQGHLSITVSGAPIYAQPIER